MAHDGIEKAGASATTCAHDVRDMVKKMAAEHSVPMPQLNEQILGSNDDVGTHVLAREARNWLKPALHTHKSEIERILTQALELPIETHTKTISVVPLPKQEHFDAIVLVFDDQNMLSNYYFKRDIDST